MCQLKLFSDEDYEGDQTSHDETRVYSESSEPFKSYKNEEDCCWEMRS